MADILEVTDATYDEKVSNAERPVLIDFTASWCGPCKAMAPAVEDLAREYAGEVDIYTLDIDANPVTAKRHGVQGIPMFMLFKGGEVVSKASGGMPRSKLAELIEGALSK